MSPTYRTARPSTSSRRGRRPAPPAGGQAGLRLRPLLLGIAAAWCGLGVQAQGGAPLPAGTLPQGAQVVVGQGQLQRSGNLLQITQTTPKLGLDWQSFSIGSASTVRFVQPDAAAVALNRVLGSDPSQIFGRLQANGQVFLTNPNGVLFAPGAQVDVGGLVASTLDLSQQDFAAGRYTFNGNSSAGVLNQGRINAADGGYVALFGRQVGNEGEIAVPGGSVVLASGRAATVAIAGGGLISAAITPAASGDAAGSVSNSGSIVADGGSVRLTAQSAEGVAASLVNNSGLIRANTLVDRGGEIWLAGDKVATSGRLQADATGGAGGDGGRIMVMGDMRRGEVRVDGVISAQAGGAGQGGQVETSAARIDIAPTARVTTLADSGRHGTWLIDPATITVDFTVDPGNAALSGNGIGASTLATGLAGGNVTLATDGGGDPNAAPGNGDITLNAPVSWAANTTLTLNAARNIHLNASLTATGAPDVNGTPVAGSAGLVLTTGTGGSYDLASAAKVTLTGSARPGAAAPLLRVNGTTYTVVNSLAALQAIDASNTSRAGSYALGVDIDASGSAALNNNAGFSPIGGSTSSNCNDSFCGRFEGFNHVISGLVVNRPADTHVGLFGGTYNATVRNLTLTGGSVVGYSNVGAVVGSAGGATLLERVGSDMSVTLSSGGSGGGGVVGLLGGSSFAQHLAASGTVSSSGAGASLGGAVGQLSGSARLWDSQASGAVVNSGTSGVTGGLVGSMDGSSSIAGSQASGNVEGGSVNGGLVGQGFGSGNIVNSSATGRVTVSNGYAGGLIGRDGLSGGLSQVQASGAVRGGSGSFGGLAGEVSQGTLTATSASGSVQGVGNVGGLVGYHTSSGNVVSSTASGAVSATGGSSVGGLIGAMSSASIIDSSASGAVNVLSDSSVQVGGLVGYFASCYYCGDYVISGSTASGSVFVDAGGGFVGGLAGLMYAGSISSSNATGAVVGIDSASATGGPSYTGGLAGYIGYYSGTGSVTSSHATGNVTGRAYTGGLAGGFGGSTVSDSSASGAVSGTSYVGGLMGYAQPVSGMSNVSASGNVSAGASASFVGGLVGEYVASGTAGLTGAFASGRVDGSAASSGYLGGLIGYLVSSSNAGSSPVNDSAATGNVIGGTYSGGLVGYSYNYYGHGGIRNSHASGNVSGAQYAGGLVGYSYNVQAGNFDILNSYATGAVSGNAVVGGLVGYMVSSIGIEGSWASGTVTGAGNSTLYLGGLVGDFSAYNPNNTGAGRIKASYASGNVRLADGLVLTGNQTVTAGGLVGLLEGTNGSLGVEDAYATGAVTLANTRGRLTAGGLVGQDNSINIRHAFATGAVTASGGNTRAAGGLVGVRTGTASVTDSVWDTTATGQASSAGGGSGLTTAQMRQAASFGTWDLAATGAAGKTWRLYEGSTTPLLTRLLTPLTLTLADASKTYDGTGSFGDASLSSASGPISHPERILAAVSSPNVGSYSVGAGGVYSTQDGYDLTVTGSATLTVNPRPLTLAGVVADKVYDGNRNATLKAGAQPSGLVAGEDLAFDASAVSAVFDNRNAGQGKTVTLSGLALADGSRGKAANYTLANATTTQASISAAPLAIGGLTAQNRIYDGTTAVALAAGSASLGGVIGSDNVQVDLSGVTGGTVADANVGSAKAVTVHGAVVGGSDAGNYLPVFTGAAVVDITPRPLDVNGLVAADRAYNRGTSVSVSTTSATLGGVVSGDLVQLQSTSVSGTMADKNVGNGKAVSVANLHLRGADAGNYTLSPATTTVNITPYQTSLFISRTNRTDRVYDGSTAADVTVNASLYGGDDVTVSANPATYADKNVAFDSAGNPAFKTITATGGALSGTDAGNYQLVTTTATTSGRISPKALTVTGVSAQNRAYDGTRNVNVNVAGATVDTSAVVAGDVVSVALPGSGTVTGLLANKNIGTAKAVSVPGFSLSGTDAANYTLNGSSGVTVNITAKPLTAIYAGVDKVYDGNAYAALSVTSNDIVAGDTVRFYADQSYCGLCGYAYFAAPGGTPSNYVASKDAGTGKTVVVNFNGLYGTDSGNYQLQNSSGSTTASITPKPITPVFSGVNKVYDGSTAATVNLNAGASGIYSGDSVALERTAVFTGSDAKNVGTGKPIAVSGIAFSGTAAGNYTLSTTTASASADITPRALSLGGISGVDRAYNGSTSVALAVTDTPRPVGVLGSDVVTLSLPSGGLSNGTMADKAVGSAKPVAVSGLSLGGADAGNYTLDSGSGVTVNIGAKPLTAVYTGVDRVYNGGVTAQVSAASPDIVSGDAVGFSQNAIFTGLDARNVGSNKPIAVSNIALTGTDNGNYALQNTTATASAAITPKPITVAYAGVDRVYDGLADRSVGVVGSSTALVAGDVVGFTQNASLRGDGSAGNAKPVDVSNVALTGAQSGNYSLSASTASTTANILKRPIGVTGITAIDRVYDGTTAVALQVGTLGVDATARVGSDEVSVVAPPAGLSSGTVDSKFAEANKPVNVTGLGLSGAQASNYTVTGAAGLTVTIRPRSVNASYAAADKVYDGSAQAQISATLDNVLSADLGALGATASGAFVDGKNVGTNKAVSVTGGQLSGAERANYTLANPSGSASASISQRTLTPAYSGGTRVYDGGVGAPVNVATAGIVAGDQLGFGQTAVFTGIGAKNVGDGKPVAVSEIAISGADAGNYRLSATTATTSASVTRKPLQVEGLTGVSAVDRVYNGSRTVDVTVSASGALSASSSDIVAGDVVSIVLPGSGLTTGSMADRHVGTAKPVVVDGLSLSGTDAGNYAIAATAGVTVNISAKPLTASYIGVNKVYDGSTAASVGGSSTDVLAGDTVAITGTGVFTGDGARNAGNSKPIQVLTGNLSGTDARDYALLNPTGTATASISRRPLTVAYSGGSRVYDGTVDAPVSASAANLVAGDAVSIGQSAVFAGSNARNVGVDKAVSVGGITLSGSDAANYALQNTTATTSGSVTPRPVVIEGLSLAAVDRVYNGSTTVDVAVQSSSGAGVRSGDLIAGDSVSVSIPAAGSTTGSMADKSAGLAKPVTGISGLSLDGTDRGNYRIAGIDGLTVNIAARPLTASYTGVNKVYDGTATATVGGSSADVVSGDSVAIAGSGVFTGGKAAGVGKAISVQAAALSGTDGSNYTLTNPTGTSSADITPRPVTASYTGGSRVYDGSAANAPVSATLDGLIAGDSVVAHQSASFTGPGARNAGSGKPVAVSGIALDGSDAGNYALVATSASTTAEITQRPLTIGGLGGLSAQDRVYDGTTSVTVRGLTALAPSSTDIIAGDDVSIRLPTVDASGQGVGLLNDKNAGTAKPVSLAGLTLGGTDAGNYRVGSVSDLTVTITPKPITATFSGVSRVYDGSTVASAIGSSADIVTGDQLSITGSGVFTDGKNVGTAKPVAVQAAALSGADKANYTLANASGSTSADVTPLTIAVAYAGGSRVYDGTLANAPVTPVLAGAVAGDDLSVQQTAVFTDSKNVGTAKPVAVSGIVLSGTDMANYALASTTATTTAAVTPRGLSITGLNGLQAVDRVYDGSTVVQVQSTGPLSASGSSGVLPGDTVAVALDGSSSTGTLADKQAGNGRAVLFGGVKLTGPDADNYSVSGTPGLTVNIAQAPLSASFGGVDKVYDGTTAATVTASLSGVIGSDSVSLGATSASFADRNVGVGKTVTVAAAGLAGADAGNYQLLAAGGSSTTASITPKPIDLAFAGLSRPYDGSLNAQVQPLFGSGALVAGDAVGSSQTARFTGTPDVGSAKPIAVTAIQLTGADAANYLLRNGSAAASADITPRVLSVAISTEVRTADTTAPPALKVTTNDGGLVGSDALTVNGTTYQAGIEKTQNGLVVTLRPTSVNFTAGSASNYAVQYTPGYLIVLPHQPQTDDAGTSNNGQPVFVVANATPEELAAAVGELGRVNAAQANGSAPARAAPTPRRIVVPLGEVPNLAALVQGDPQRLSLNTLLQAPLLSVDPALMRPNPAANPANLAKP